jgi:hypothetical protein
MQRVLQQSVDERVKWRTGRAIRSSRSSVGRQAHRAASGRSRFRRPARWRASERPCRHAAADLETPGHRHLKMATRFRGQGISGTGRLACEPTGRPAIGIVCLARIKGFLTRGADCRGRNLILNDAHQRPGASASARSPGGPGCRLQDVTTWRSLRPAPDAKPPDQSAAVWSGSWQPVAMAAYRSARRVKAARTSADGSMLARARRSGTISASSARVTYGMRHSTDVRQETLI